MTELLEILDNNKITYKKTNNPTEVLIKCTSGNHNDENPSLSYNLENNISKEQFQELLDAIDGLEDTNIIFTKANSDIDGKIINQMIDEYVNKNNYKSREFIS